MRLQDLITQINQKLNSHSDLNNEQKIWWILEEVTEKKQSELIGQKNFFLNSDQLEKINFILDKHINEHMPLQYLFGYVPFLENKIFVKPPILIPRPETENWCADLIKELNILENKKIKILDIGTGSGCIPIALAKSFPEAEIVAIDISNDALELSKKNVLENKIKNIKLIKSDLFENLENEKFDLIVSNPPYIPEKLFETLELSVKDWEDPKALIAKDEGLKIIKEIISKAEYFLKINNEFVEKNLPQLILEIDYLQGKQVSDFMKSNNFFNIEVNKDLQQKDRVVRARRFSDKCFQEKKGNR